SKYVNILLKRYTRERSSRAASGFKEKNESYYQKKCGNGGKGIDADSAAQAAENGHEKKAQRHHRLRKSHRLSLSMRRCSKRDQVIGRAQGDRTHDRREAVDKDERREARHEGADQYKKSCNSIRPFCNRHDVKTLEKKGF